MTSLFGPDDPPPLAARLAPILQSLAKEGIYCGTSSWKYTGWIGSIYSADRYQTRNRFSKKKFEENCLHEYAETFASVCGDFSFYQFPTRDSLVKLFAGLPAKFAVSFKVPEPITVFRWPGHARYGARSGLLNEHFLDPLLFESAFLRPLERYRHQVGVLILEFGTFAKTELSSEEFLKGLNLFLSTLPTGWRYAVEIRNDNFLIPDYFATLANHNVAHVFNAWTRMPTISDQIAIAEAHTADFSVVRALLKKGRSYEAAVKLFEPYENIQEQDPKTREALRQMIGEAARNRRKAFIYVNNRLEGSAPATIEAVVSEQNA